MIGKLVRTGVKQVLKIDLRRGRGAARTLAAGNAIQASSALPPAADPESGGGEADPLRAWIEETEGAGSAASAPIGHEASGSPAPTAGESAEASHASADESGTEADPSADNDPDEAEEGQKGHQRTEAGGPATAGKAGKRRSLWSLKKKGSVGGKRFEASPTSQSPTFQSSMGGGSGGPPIQVIVDWIAEARQNDVIHHARGAIQDHFGSLENAWLAVAPFAGGYFFEIHEGGDGRSHLPTLVEELTRDSSQMLWLPSGTRLNRAVVVSVIDDIPDAAMLNEEESRKVRDSGQSPLPRTGRMQRAQRKGERVLAAGAVVSLLGILVVAGSMVFSLLAPRYVAQMKKLDAARLPIGQLALLNAVTSDRYVERLVFENGKWEPTWRSVPEITLPDGREDLRRMLPEILKREAAKSAGLPVEADPPSFSETRFEKHSEHGDETGAPSGGSGAERLDDALRRRIDAIAEGAAAPEAEMQQPQAPEAGAHETEAIPGQP